MNYKRKHFSKRKYRYLRRGWNGDGILKIRAQINRHYRDEISEYIENTKSMS